MSNDRPTRRPPPQAQARPAEEQSPRPRRPAPPAPNPILVVEDQTMARRNLCRTLEYYQNTVIEAATGREAVRIFHRDHRRIGMVLLDLTLPDVPAATVLAALRTLDPQVRVVVCTEESISETRGDESLAGVAGVLRKPIRADQLLAAVRRALYG